MSGANFKATNSSFQKGITFCRSIYVKKVMKLLAFIFEQPSYLSQIICMEYHEKTLTKLEARFFAQVVPPDYLMVIFLIKLQRN